jgi:hypothetical protein
MRYFHRLAVLCATGLLLAVSVWAAPVHAVAGGVHPDTAACHGKWQVFASPNRGSQGSTLSATDAVATGDVWAVGNSFTGAVYRTLAEHWDGVSWTISPTRNVGLLTNSLNALAAVATDDVWAVGFYADGTTFRTLAEHWNGSRWTVVPTPNDGTGQNVLESVSAVTPSDVWAVGFRQAAPGSPRVTLIEHWNGASWSVVPSPNVGSDENFLWSVSARTTSDVWAFGSYSVPWFQTLVEHWNGASWSVVPSPNLDGGSNVLYAGVASTPSRVMAVGTWLDGDKTASLGEQWNGSSFSVVPSESPAAEQNFLVGAAGATRNDLWAVGWRVDVPFTASQTLSQHWNGTAWAVVKTPNAGTGSNALAGVTVVPGDDTVWAVGHSEAGPVDQTLVMSRC